MTTRPTSRYKTVFQLLLVPSISVAALYVDLSGSNLDGASLERVQNPHFETILATLVVRDKDISRCQVTMDESFGG